MKTVGKGAEAIIEKKQNNVIKRRISKSYRHPEIDKELRQHRTRREAKVLDKATKIGLKAPSLKEMNDKEMHIEMEYLKGHKLRDVLHKSPKEYSREIGKKIALMHNNNIIHGDLTTSNMILHNDEIHFIDFGLSFFSTKIEDKAVDLHLLERALESKHHKICEQCTKAALRGYKQTSKHSTEVLKRLEQVRSRGRNKESH